VLTNTGSGSAVDLDSFIFQGQVGSGGSISNTTIDDTDSRFTYAPSDIDWEVVTRPNLNKNDTLHVTQTQGASATIPFSGNAVAVYGTVSPDHADIQVSLDGQNTTVQGGAGGFAGALHTQTLLYYADNLGPEQHQLVLSADQTPSTGQFMDVDAVTIFSSAGGNSSNGANNASPSSSNNGNNFASTSRASRHIPVIVGAAVCAVVLTLLMIFLLFIFHRRRQKKRKSWVDHSITPTLPLQQDMMETGHRNRDSSHFLDVKLSPGGRSSRPLEPVAFPTVSRSGSTRSYSSTTPLISNTTSTTSQLDSLILPPTVPPLTFRSNQSRDTGTGPMGTRAPSRPPRPSSLQLSPDSWNM